MYNLDTMLKRCWYYLGRGRSLFAFNVFGHLSKEERTGKNVSPYLWSVGEYFPSPWLYPITKCAGPKDSREQSRRKQEILLFRGLATETSFLHRRVYTFGHLFAKRNCLK